MPVTPTAGRLACAALIATIAMIPNLTTPAAAQGYSEGDLKFAAAIAAYEESADTCFYEGAVERVIAKYEDMAADQYGWDWDDMKAQGATETQMLLNMGRMQGGGDPCVAYGVLIGMGLLPVMLLEADPEVMTAIGRLADSGGRAR